METVVAAARFSSLGHELRLELFRLLVRAGDDGLAVGELQALLERPASTTAFHLRELVDADLVRQDKEGRTIRCRANFGALNELLMYLKHDCCRGVSLPAFATRKTA
jgi:ArsR family transcriptional regulator, arsenate/arsenite/antimonite-responsive transcriptional repressor